VSITSHYIIVTLGCLSNKAELLSFSTCQLWYRRVCPLVTLCIISTRKPSWCKGKRATAVRVYEGP